MSCLPQLRESLVAAAERQANQVGAHSLLVTERSGGVPSQRRPQGLVRVLFGRRSRTVALLFAGLLAMAAVAYATTSLIKTGAPVESEESFSRAAGAGVAIPQSEGLLGIAAPDPAGGPPWTMRVYKTSRGLGCVQVGRLVGGRIGVLGEDGAFNEDGRFHPLPVQASQAEGECVLLDGHGHAFLGVSRYGVPASGLPYACDRLGSRVAGERCWRSSPRDVFYGLLGPKARSVTYRAGGETHTIPTVGKEGAYLIVEGTPAEVVAKGVGAGVSSAVPAGGGTLGAIRLPQPIKVVRYSGGHTCTISQFRDYGGHGGECVPPVGYVAQNVHLPSARELASSVQVRGIVAPLPAGYSRKGPVAQLRVSFVARVAVRSALSGYSVSLEAPNTGRCKGRAMQANAQLGHNVRAGERVSVNLAWGFADARGMFPGCPGVAHGVVTYSIPSHELSTGPSYGPFVRRHSGIVTVGRFSYDSPS
ncbi:MAG TPA: hypothetical protein VGI26_01215 [Solirubrobacteraceae bacterium]|jgi:hypothetical protein